MNVAMTTAILLATLAATGAAAAPAPGDGTAIIAAMTGKAYARAPVGARHDGVTEETEVRVADAFTAGHTLRTDRKGTLCIVLSPGAVLCMEQDTVVHLQELSERPRGLPQREQELIRKIELQVQRGNIRFYGGASSANQHYKISFGGATLHLDGGTFELSGGAEGKWSAGAMLDGFELKGGAAPLAVEQGELAEISSQGGKVRYSARRMTPQEVAGLAGFTLCDEVFTYLDPLVFRVDGVDLNGLADLVGEPAGLTLIGDPNYWEDVSPTAIVRRPTPPGGPAGTGRPLADGRLMGREEIWTWFERVGEIKGVNYLPRNAVNAIEMWNKDSFDGDLIKEELKWARSAGFNMLRVPLSFTAWKEDPKGFLERTDQFLEIAQDQGFRTALVLLDDTNRAGRDPQPGAQPDPVPGVHNSQWVPSVAASLVVDTAAWDDIEAYVKAVVHEYRRDDRVLFWDVYQTPGNAGLWDKSLPLMEAAFKWVREEKPEQPLTAGPWKDFSRPMSVRIMELSDFISLQTFDDPKILTASLHLLGRFKRPIVCTDWLKRQAGNTFENMLPLFRQHRVGWFSRGLVQGRSQLIYPEERKWTKSEEPLWQQDILRPDGTPYRDEEVRLIRSFEYLGK